MTGLRVDSSDFDKAAAAFKGGDKVLRREVGKSLRSVGKPLGERVVRAAAASMPKRGGFAGLVADARIGMRFSTSSSPSVQLLLKDRSNHDLRALEAGILRHPVFMRGGDRKAATWRAQKVPSGRFSAAFEAEKSKVAAEVLGAMQATVNEIARKAT